MRRLASYISGILAVLATAGIALLMLVIVLDVGRRSLFSRSIPGAVEASEMLLVAIVFLGLAFAEGRRAHVSVSVVVRHLPTRLARVLELTTVLLGVAVVCWMTWETTAVAIDSVERGETRSGLIRVPLWPARVAIPIGLSVFAIQLAIRAWGLLFKQEEPSSSRAPEAEI